MKITALIILLSFVFSFKIIAGNTKDKYISLPPEIQKVKIGGNDALIMVHHPELAKKTIVNTKNGTLSISVLGTAKLFEMNFSGKDKCGSSGNTKTTVRLLRICDNLFVADIENGNCRISMKTINNKWKIIDYKSSGNSIKYFISSKFKYVI